MTRTAPDRLAAALSPPDPSTAYTYLVREATTGRRTARLIPGRRILVLSHPHAQGRTVPKQRWQPVSPKPDPRCVFLEPVYTNRAAAATYAEAWEEEQRERATRRRQSRHP